jgi:tryptophanyl-tRNA synthetase
MKRRAGVAGVARRRTAGGARSGSIHTVHFKALRNDKRTMTDKRRVLTGITTTGTPHLGNYVGAIRPAIAASRRDDVESFYFLADYHALVKCGEPERVRRSTLEIAATWLACGLDPERVFFYRQSDIVEIPELTWLLTCVTAKGLLNRAHAYKAAVEQNATAGEDPDAGITAGLYMYPVLMAADILVFSAHEVPVGRDQVQHIEMARDIAQRFNHLYADDLAHAGVCLTLPEARIEESVATLPGTDGRKMSKSYDNTTPLWLPAKALEKAILGIVTDSRAPGEPKDPETSNLFAIYRAFATEDEAAAMRRAFADGIAWGEAKRRLFERVDAELAPMRGRYEALIADPAAIEDRLRDGARKARELSRPFVESLRRAAGIRDLRDATVAMGGSGSAGATTNAPSLDATTPASPSFKSYREADGRFHFKLVAADERVLLQSRGFDSPKDAGRLMAALVDDAAAFAPVAAGDGFAIIGGDGVELARGADAAEVRAALQRLREDKAAKQKS